MERIFNEENQKNNINLNYNELENIISKENEFFIDKSQFLADIDIKFLLQSRCANLIEEYENTLYFEYANKFEKELFAKAMSFGFKLNFAVDILTTQELKIRIDYFDSLDIGRTTQTNNFKEILAFKVVTFTTCAADIEADKAWSYPTSAHVADADVNVEATKVNLPVRGAVVASFTE
jgi:hypothetical protein